ncbi:MAG: hypothetical protein H7Y86_03255 [Rhizobacter sp.]|nr:hypothetical protein [Ferruginibacter sp.]
MVAFKQAAFNADSVWLQQYFEERTDESEKNINELNEILAGVSGSRFDVENAVQHNLLGTNHLFTGKKNINMLLKNIQYLEKAIITWYKTVMKNLKGRSLSTTQLLSRHYSGLQASHVYMQSC